MDSIAAFPFRVEVWDMNDVGIDEVLAYCRNVTVARGAYERALHERPDRIVRLRNRAMVLAERIPSDHETGRGSSVPPDVPWAAL